MTEPNTNQPPTGPTGEQTLHVEQMQVERKILQIMLNENRRGRFLRIVEMVAQNRNSVIVPASGFQQFKQLLDRTLETSDKLPPDNPS